MKREIPAVLWISLVAMGGVSVIQALMGLASFNLTLLVGVMLNLVLLYGLYHGRPWAFVITLAFGLLGVLIALVSNPGAGLVVMFLNGLVLVPMYLAKDYFWPPSQCSDFNAVNFCARCGQDLRGVQTTNCPRCGCPFD